MADTTGGYPVTEPHQCPHCAEHHPDTKVIGPPLCWCVAGLAAALMNGGSKSPWAGIHALF